MEPNRAKALGGVGSALIFLISLVSLIYPESTFIGANPEAIYESPSQTVAIMMISSLFWALSYLIGPILVLLGLRGLGDYYNDEGIKRNALRWFIWWAVAVTAASYYTATATLSSVSNVAISTLFIAAIVLLLATVIFIIISAVYLKRAYAALAARTGEGLFNTAAKLYWWGSLLLVPVVVAFFLIAWIMVLVGALLVWISWLISAIAFFSMKLRQSDAAAAAAKVVPPPPPDAVAARATP